MSSLKLSLFRPTRSKRISQHFGENRACSYPNGKIVGKQGHNCPAGSVDFYKSIGMLAHNGQDIPGILGEDVVHAGTFDGYMKIESDYSGGLGVDVISNVELFFEGKAPKGLTTFVNKKTHKGVIGFTCYVKVRYWHLHAQIGYDGKNVSFGQTVGLMGSTGASSGTHLHWSWKFCNEFGRNLLPNNGYYGAFDPESPEFGVSYNHEVFAGDSVEYLGINQHSLFLRKRNYQ